MLVAYAPEKTKTHVCVADIISGKTSGSRVFSVRVPCFPLTDRQTLFYEYSHCIVAHLHFDL